ARLALWITSYRSGRLRLDGSTRPTFNQCAPAVMAARPLPSMAVSGEEMLFFCLEPVREAESRVCNFKDFALMSASDNEPVILKLLKRGFPTCHGTAVTRVGEVHAIRLNRLPTDIASMNYGPVAVLRCF